MGSKYGLHILCGLVLLGVGFFYLPLEMNTELSSIFAFLWIGVGFLYVIANARKMVQVRLLQQRQMERARRQKWLEAQKQVASQRKRRGRVQGVS